MSFMRSKNNNGPSIDPCGTPDEHDWIQISFYTVLIPDADVYKF